MGDPFTLQAHITDACDLHCRHCYRDERRGELDLAAWRGILADFAAFCRGRRMEGRITFAGGEPLLRFGDLLELTRQAKEAGHQVHLLTNGIRLTTEKARELKAAGCLRVQVSVDGNEGAHEAVRGKGTYAGALEGLRQARAAGMATTVSMTVGQNNVEDVAGVAQVAQELGAKLFISRLVPCGRGAAMADELLPAGQWLTVMQKCVKQAQKLGGNVALRDPLYGRLAGHGGNCEGCVAAGVGGCACGYGGLAVEADGAAYPCRRMPVGLGNLAQAGLEDIWRSEVLEALRDRDKLEGACGKCAWRWQCGGCRAIAWANSGSYLAPDPQCPWTQGRWRQMATKGLKVLKGG